MGHLTLSDSGNTGLRAGCMGLRAPSGALLRFAAHLEDTPRRYSACERHRSGAGPACLQGCRRAPFQWHTQRF